jgi:hypothetical protein
MRPVLAEMYLFGIRDNEDRAELTFPSYMDNGADSELIIRLIDDFGVFAP